MEYEKEFALEQQYLKKTCDFVRENLTREEEACADEKDQVIAARREMWETVSFRGGFDNAVEAHQALESIQAQSARYDAAHKRIDHLHQALETPYFARVDFTENANFVEVYHHFDGYPEGLGADIYEGFLDKDFDYVMEHLIAGGDMSSTGVPYHAWRDEDWEYCKPKFSDK